MELGLSLGDASKPFGHIEKDPEGTKDRSSLEFCMGLSISSSTLGPEDKAKDKKADVSDEDVQATTKSQKSSMQHYKENLLSVSPSLQLDLLPKTHVFPWQHSSENGSSEGGSFGNMSKSLDVNMMPTAEEAEDLAAISSPNSASSFHMDFSIFGGNKRDSQAANNEVEAERASLARASDEDENGTTRKKLRLSKEQSAFLEESFKEHSTLNPKQKLALAKQLGLRPRQVEVWFQNRRARTKLKQTEVDCEYLKRCCETLTEENRRLHKELQELRALKTSNPFYMQLPATTLTMCPSCERVVATTSATNTDHPSKPAEIPIAAKPLQQVLPVFSNSKPTSSLSSFFTRNG